MPTPTSNGTTNEGSFNAFSILIFEDYLSWLIHEALYEELKFLLCNFTHLYAPDAIKITTVIEDNCRKEVIKIWNK